jgi:hypothetical protein
MMAAFLPDLRQPEYIHVLLNPLPVYGLLFGWIGLISALLLRNRRAQIVTLALVLVASASAWPAYEYGEEAYDRVLSMADDAGQAWLDEHKARAEKLIWLFYALAFLSALAIALPLKWPGTAAPLVIAVILLGAISMGTAAYISYAGGRIRHREFRNEPNREASEPLRRTTVPICSPAVAPPFSFNALTLGYRGNGDLPRSRGTRGQRTQRRSDKAAGLVRPGVDPDRVCGRLKLGGHRGKARLGASLLLVACDFALLHSAGCRRHSSEPAHAAGRRNLSMGQVRVQ